MSIEQHRHDILRAYSIFSPASVDIIARIEHMQQIPNIHIYCEQLHEEGLLKKNNTVDTGIVEYMLTDCGKTMINMDVETLCPAKVSIFEQLRSREHMAMSIRSFILTALQTSSHFLSILQIQDMVNKSFEQRINLAELHSFVYGLLFNDDIVACGPLFGVIVTSSNDHEQPNTSS